MSVSRRVSVRILVRILSPIALTALFCAPVHASDNTCVRTPPSAQQTYQITAEGALRRDVAHGIYQLVYNPAQRAVYVASAEYVPDVEGGAIYKLDPDTLETLEVIPTRDKNFGLTINPSGDTLFTASSVDYSASKIDLQTGKVTGHIEFTERGAGDRRYEPHAIMYDATDNLLYVGGSGVPGRIWVMDPETFTVKATIDEPGPWVTGMLRDPDSPRVFAANSAGEVLVIDTRSYQIVERWQPSGEEYAFLLNFALDRAGGRLFVTDHRASKTLLVLDVKTGKLLERAPVGESLEVLYHPQNNALYLTHRERGLVSVIDADTFAVRSRHTLPPHPNSLAISPDGKQVFVSIKLPFTRINNEGHYACSEESVARIDLR